MLQGLLDRPKQVMRPTGSLPKCEGVLRFKVRSGLIRDISPALIIGVGEVQGLIMATGTIKVIGRRLQMTEEAMAAIMAVRTEVNTPTGPLELTISKQKAKMLRMAARGLTG